MQAIRTMHRGKNYHARAKIRELVGTQHRLVAWRVTKLKARALTSTTPCAKIDKIFGKNIGKNEQNIYLRDEKCKN